MRPRRSRTGNRHFLDEPEPVAVVAATTRAPTRGPRATFERDAARAAQGRRR
jgi:hypothetical protein